MSPVHVSHRIKGIALAFLPLLTLILISCGTTIYPTFSHQGKLLDSSGNPVADGNYTVVYRLYHEVTDGTAVYTDTNTVAITDGYFNSSFGAIDVDPKIFSERTWLEVTVNGETLAPRQYMQGAPYASGLVAGSAAIGSQPITYTYSGYDNLGSSFFVANTDSSAMGGSGLTAVNTAELVNGSPAKLDAAAIRGLSIDTDLDSFTGTYAGIFVSEDYRGIYVHGDSSNWYAAYFDGDVNIAGNCIGCALAMTAQNRGEATIERGDFVTAVGVEVDAEYGFPIIFVRKAVAGDAVLGVASRAMYRGDYHEGALTQIGYEQMDGNIDRNGYLSVATEGLVQAQLAANNTLNIGDYIAFNATGLTAISSANDSVAQVMSEADKSGLQWILLNR